MTQGARKLGISRQWLSEMKAVFEKNKKDPRSLEPESKAPKNTKKRKRVPKEVEDKILEVRALSKNVWGKQKIAVVLERDHHIKVNPNTVNKYLHKHKKIDPKISKKNGEAWKAKKDKEKPETNFAQPFGYTSPEIETAIKEAGYTTARGILWGTLHSSKDIFHLSGYFASDNFKDFVHIVNQ